MHSPDNRFAVTVDLTAPDGEPFTGTCEGEDSPTAQLESAATAAIRALEVAANHEISLAIRRTTEIGDLNTILVHLSISRAERHNGLLLWDGFRERPAASCRRESDTESHEPDVRERLRDFTVANKVSDPVVHQTPGEGIFRRQP